MKFLEKLKWLMKIQKPAGDVVVAVKEVKKTKKWFHFGVTLVGILASTAATLKGVIPVEIGLIVSTALQSIYNIVRGADKADDAEIKGTLRTTEFWLAALTEVEKGFSIVQTGGIWASWFPVVSSMINFLTLALGQNLAARTPSGESAVTKSA